jgi:cobalamin synthase
MNQVRSWFGPLLMGLMILVAVVLLGFFGLVLLGITLVLTLGLSLRFEHHLQGINGDCCGASIMIVQTVLLLGASSAFHLGLPVQGYLGSW